MCLSMCFCIWEGNVLVYVDLWVSHTGFNLYVRDTVRSKRWVIVLGLSWRAYPKVEAFQFNLLSYLWTDYCSWSSGQDEVLWAFHIPWLQLWDSWLLFEDSSFGCRWLTWWGLASGYAFCINVGHSCIPGTNRAEGGGDWNYFMSIMWLSFWTIYHPWESILFLGGESVRIQVNLAEWDWADRHSTLLLI